MRIFSVGFGDRRIMVDIRMRARLTDLTDTRIEKLPKTTKNERYLFKYEVTIEFLSPIFSSAVLSSCLAFSSIPSPRFQSCMCIHIVYGSQGVF